VEGIVGPEPGPDRCMWRREGAMPLLRALRNILAMGHMRCRDIARAMDMALSWVFEVINN